MKGVTQARLQRAYRIAANRLLKPDSGLIACEHDAGTEVDASGEGVQVFVAVRRFSRALLKAHPHTGGLLIYEPVRLGKLAKARLIAKRKRSRK